MCVCVCVYACVCMRVCVCVCVCARVCVCQPHTDGDQVDGTSGRVGVGLESARTQGDGRDKVCIGLVGFIHFCKPGELG